MKSFEWAVAKTVEGAAKALGEGYEAKAGGVDLLDRLKERIDAPDKVVGLMGLDRLKGVSRAEDGSPGARIGALTTLAELAEDATIGARFAALAHAAGEAATPQVRAVATVGGNLLQRPRCWYYRQAAYDCLKKGGETCFAIAGDSRYHALFGNGPCHIVHPSNVAPPLMAAGATLRLRSAEGAVRDLTLDRFFVRPSKSVRREHVMTPDELLEYISLPALPTRSGYAEIRHKQSFDWPLATCAAVRMAEGWKIVLGGVAPVPWRSGAAEKVLAGADRVDPSLAKRAATAAMEGATPLAGSRWRLPLVGVAIQRAIAAAEGRS